MKSVVGQQEATTRRVTKFTHLDVTTKGKGGGLLHGYQLHFTEHLIEIMKTTRRKKRHY